MVCWDAEPDVLSWHYHFPHHSMKTFSSKTLLIATFALLMIGCSSPQNKVEQMEKKNEALQESSGYNECMRQVKNDEKKIEDCISAKIVAAGYTDEIRCVGTNNYDTESLCRDTKRYNTEVDAKNNCPNEVTFETTLGEGDCNQMLMDAQ